jgi:predicted glycoside hydrolase/deacetylase ChbG (UPF0249 family)
MKRALAIVVLVCSSAWSQPVGPTVQERLGHPASARLLVINADDLGMAHSVNRATFEALEKGWVGSASVLVPCPWFPEVARFARAHPEFELGIHLALNSEWTSFRWGPLSSVDTVPSLLDETGYLPLLEEMVAKQADPAQAERELRAQIERAKSAGIRLSHLDTHMGTLFHTAALFDVYRRLAGDYGLPLRVDRVAQLPPGASVPEGEVLLDRVVSIEPGVDAAGWRAAYEKMLAPLPPGVYELVVHLAYDDEEMRGATSDHPNWGAAWRQQGRDLIASQGFRDFLRAQNFVLVDWRTLARARRPAGR